MSAVSTLSDRLSEATALLREREEAVRRSPSDFALRMTVESLGAHVEDLRTELRRAQLERRVEVVQIRLLGRLAESGSLPLHLLSRLADSFADSVHAATQKLKSGRQVRRISAAVVQMLNLRLADVTPGSTRLYVTGDVAPDLFGRSLLADALADTFDLFRAGSDEELAGAVGRVGIRSARATRDFLQAIRGAELEVELAWTAPDDERRAWRGGYESIAKLSRSLSHFEIREPAQVRIVGEAVTLSARGRFEIVSGDRIYLGTFPTDLLPVVAKIHIGEEVRAVLERTVIRNTVTGVEKSDFVLIALEGSGQTRFGGVEHGVVR